MNKPHSVAVITVTYNAGRFIGRFLESLYAVDTSNVEMEVIVVDNGSADDTVQSIRDNYPAVAVIHNDENNYARALNLAIASSRSEFVAIINNDASVHVNWLQGFLPVFAANPLAGAVQSKIFFEGKNRLNSVGVEQVGHFYFKDTAFDRQDSKRYSKPAKREYITGGSMMLRRSALEDVGLWDEEFIMFMEDVDYSERCRAKGWELWFAPDSILYHQYHGSTSQAMCDYFCNRNRFLFVAKHFPGDLAASIHASEFYKKGEFDLLYRSLLHAVRSMAACHDTATVDAVLQALGRCLPGYIGDISAWAFFSQLEIVLGLRKIRVGIYGAEDLLADSGPHTAAAMMEKLKERGDVTCIFNSDKALASYLERLGTEVASTDTKLLRPPAAADEAGSTSNDADIACESSTLFAILARESLEYDIFVNVSAPLELKPLSSVSWFVGDAADHTQGLESDSTGYEGHFGPGGFHEKLDSLLDWAEAELLGRDVLPMNRGVA